MEKKFVCDLKKTFSSGHSVFGLLDFDPFGLRDFWPFGFLASFTYYLDHSCQVSHCNDLLNFALNEIFEENHLPQFSS